MHTPSITTRQRSPSRSFEERLVGFLHHSFLCFEFSSVWKADTHTGPLAYFNVSPAFLASSHFSYCSSASHSSPSTSLDQTNSLRSALASLRITLNKNKVQVFLNSTFSSIPSRSSDDLLCSSGSALREQLHSSTQKAFQPPAVFFMLSSLDLHVIDHASISRLLRHACTEAAFSFYDFHANVKDLILDKTQRPRSFTMSVLSEITLHKVLVTLSAIAGFASANAPLCEFPFAALVTSY